MLALIAEYFAAQRPSLVQREKGMTEGEKQEVRDLRNGRTHALAVIGMPDEMLGMHFTWPRHLRRSVVLNAGSKQVNSKGRGLLELSAE